MTDPKDAFGMLAEHLRQAVYALEAGKGRDDGQPLPGSPAAAENQNEELRGAWGEEPARDANTLARLLCISASDHLLALADLLQSRNTGAYVSYTVGRGVLEAAGRAWYLTDPAANVRDRVRRYMNERLWNIDEARRFLGGLQSDTSELDRLEQEIRQSAEINGFTVRKFRSGWQLDQERPSASKLCDLLLSPETAGAGFGSATYRVLTSTAHGAQSGLVSRLVDFDGRRVTVVKDSETLARYLVWPVKAYLSMGDRFLEHHGWDKTGWEQAREATLAAWVQHATQRL